MSPTHVGNSICHKRIAIAPKFRRMRFVCRDRRGACGGMKSLDKFKPVSSDVSILNIGFNQDESEVLLIHSGFHEKLRITLDKLFT